VRRFRRAADHGSASAEESLGEVTCRAWVDAASTYSRPPTGLEVASQIVRCASSDRFMEEWPPADRETSWTARHPIAALRPDTDNPDASAHLTENRQHLSRRDDSGGFEGSHRKQAVLIAGYEEICLPRARRTHVRNPRYCWRQTSCFSQSGMAACSRRAMMSKSRATSRTQMKWAKPFAVT
jgi:hypothetical protein